MSIEQKPLCVVRAPCATRSGYGDMSRDIIRHLIEYDKFDVKVHSVNWGDTPMNALDENNPKDKMILDRIVRESINKQPDLFVSITVPNEFEPIGKYNIGITAGIETTATSPQWIEGCNRMNAIFTISEHSKNVFMNSKYGYKTPQNTQGTLELSRPIEVLHNCIDKNIFGKKAPTDAEFTKTLNTIPETFCFAFVGHWLRGEYSEDRKNVGALIKLFLETFKQITDRPLPGHMDFLRQDEAVLVGGELKNVHPSSVWENVIMAESQWFTADPQQCVNAMGAVFMDYTTFKNRAYNTADRNRKQFSYESIQKRTWELLDKYVPEFPKQLPLVLPKLKKIELPKLNKVE